VLFFVRPFRSLSSRGSQNLRHNVRCGNVNRESGLLCRCDIEYTDITSSRYILQFDIAAQHWIIQIEFFGVLARGTREILAALIVVKLLRGVPYCLEYGKD
jgi:hypothetical protein